MIGFIKIGDVMARVKEQLICKDPSLTHQCFKDECDINNIMAKWVKDGLATHVMQYQGRYEDLSGVEDYHTSLNRVIAAQEAFDSLPAVIRSKFENDPGKFLDFVGDPANVDEMANMGLLPENYKTNKDQSDNSKIKAPSNATSSENTVT